MGRLMLVAPGACVTLAAARAHVLLGLYVGGSSILALDRMLRRLALCRGERRPLTALRVPRLMLGSAAAGAIVVGTSVAVFAGFCQVVHDRTMSGPEAELGTILVSAVPALCIAVWTGAALRHAFRGPAPSTREVVVAAPPPPD